MASTCSIGPLSASPLQNPPVVSQFSLAADLAKPVHAVDLLKVNQVLLEDGVRIDV